MRVQNPVVPLERIEKAIFFLRGHKVMLSTHLAELYEVEPRALVQAVKRNIERFPPDFMFQLSKVEFENLKSQIVTSNWGGLRRAAPYAFTEQGVAMLSSVLNSRRAVQVNIEIMRAFVRLREIMATHKDLVRRLNEMEKKYDAQFRVVFDAIRELMAPPDPKKDRVSGKGASSAVRKRVKRSFARFRNCENVEVLARSCYRLPRPIFPQAESEMPTSH